MYVLVKEMMKRVHTCVEDHHPLPLPLRMAIHDLNMEMVNNTIPCALQLSDEHHHHSRPVFDVVTAVVSSTMHRLVIVLSAVPDVNLKLFLFFFVFVLHMVLICTTVCFQIIKNLHFHHVKTHLLFLIEWLSYIIQ